MEIKFKVFDKINKKWLKYELSCVGWLMGVEPPKESKDWVYTDGYGKSSLQHCLNNPDVFGVVQYIGLMDKNKKDIYSDYLLKDDKGIVFRVYLTFGGFVTKAEYWKSDIGDLIPSDQLIFDSMSDIQYANWIEQECEIVGSIYQNKKLKPIYQ